MDLDLTIKNYRCFSDERPAQFSLRKGFTAFVGPNNSGKSSLLKFFFEFRNLFSLLSDPSNYTQAMRGQWGVSPPRTVQDENEMFHNGNDRPLSIEVQLNHAPSIPLPAPLLTKVGVALVRGKGFQVVPLEPQLVSSSRALAVNGSIVSVQNSQDAIDVSKMTAAMSMLADTIYVGAFRNILNLSTKADYFDIQVGEAFVKQWKDEKLGPNKIRNDNAYRVEKDIRRIFGYRELQINPANDDQTLRLIIDGHSYGLSELGSGIAQFILTLANVGSKRPSYVLIDEPELNLHPTLQLDFLTTLASYAKEGVIFATHSVGLARAIAQRVYSLQKKNGRSSEVTIFGANPRLSEFLGELSFFGYKELGFEKVLLVEGTTEVLTIQQLLRMYGKDHEVVLLHLGGSSLINGSDATIVQLEEVKRISDNVSALIDSEKDKSGALLQPERVAFVDVCRQAGITCHVLERKAMENYLTDSAIKRVKGEKYRELGHYESLKSLSPHWAKSENWRIAREMNREDIGSTDLGQFLASL